MKVILATRNRYLEYGLQALLKGHSVILAREFFPAGEPPLYPGL
ncbi:Uncharacterised protein [Escherichia coli]|uniref:Uncharacterized protein n=1 Tax=Escherichia coli TaxID=562 RepID=A0A376DN51_ECOLX|nr:Uncharacterised protein [Escherichia coli]